MSITHAPPPTRTPLVRGTGLSHRFGANPALFTDLDLELHPGQVVGLCGPSGSGKSTLLSIIAGWERPTGGTLDRANITRTCWVFQNPHGVPQRTAIDHVVLPLLAGHLSRSQAEDRALAILSQFNLVPVAGRPFRDLSGGEAQRLMLARAVARAPDLLLVDEPTAQLDQHTAATVNQTLAHVAQDNSIVVIATHDQATRAACTNVIDLAPDGQPHTQAHR